MGTCCLMYNVATTTSAKGVPPTLNQINRCFTLDIMPRSDRFYKSVHVHYLPMKYYYTRFLGEIVRGMLPDIFISIFRCFW